MLRPTRPRPLSPAPSPDLAMETSRAVKDARFPPALATTEVTVMAETTVTLMPRQWTNQAGPTRIRADRTTQHQGEVEAQSLPEGSRWQRWAACRKTPTTTFFPTGNSQLGRVEEEAKAVCSTCQVQAQCLTFAIEHQEPHGIWGGLNTEERRVLATPIRKPSRAE